MPGTSAGCWEGAEGAFGGVGLKGHAGGTVTEESQVFEVGTHTRLTKAGGNRRFPRQPTAPQPGRVCGPHGSPAHPEAAVPLPSAPVGDPDSPPLKQTCGARSVPSAATSVPTSPPGGFLLLMAEGPQAGGPASHLVSRSVKWDTNGLYLRGWHRQTHRNVTLHIHRKLIHNIQIIFKL